VFTRQHSRFSNGIVGYRERRVQSNDAAHQRTPVLTQKAPALFQAATRFVTSCIALGSPVAEHGARPELLARVGQDIE
jgi:hypothetical protein